MRDERLTHSSKQRKEIFMSVVLIVAPVVVTSWPFMVPAITAVVTSLGYAVVADVEQEINQDCLECLEDGEEHHMSEEFTLENSEILAEARDRGETMTIVNGNVRATFHRDARGTLRLTVHAVGLSKAEIRKIGDELIGKVTQQYAYNRLVTEMKERGMEIIEETVEEDNTVRIRVRNNE
jgi:hypothetical protein